MFATEHQSFLLDNEPEYDVFEFDDFRSTADCLLIIVSESAYEYVSPHALELKPLHNSLKYVFLGPNESLPVSIAFDLDQD